MQDPKVIVALDHPGPVPALECVQALRGEEPFMVKVGKELFTADGPAILRSIRTVSFGKTKVFFDLKFHDIPSTVARAVKAAAEHGVWGLTLHASGGRKMLDAAVEAALQCDNPPKLIAVTVLTSMEEDDLEEIGIYSSLNEEVEMLATLAQDCGCDGVVSSALETSMLRQKLGENFIYIAPSIRPVGADHNDQARVTTPEAAIQMGANYLVVGRPITGAKDKKAALMSINRSIGIF